MEVSGSGTTKVATTTSKHRQLSSLVWFVSFSYLSEDCHKSQIVQTLKPSFCVLLDVQGCSNQQTPKF